MQPNNLPHQGAKYIIKNAFYYWRKSLLFQVLFTLITLGLIFAVGYYLIIKFGILADIQQIIENSKGNTQAIRKNFDAYANQLAKDPKYLGLFYIIMGLQVFLYPLQIGLLKIYRKIDLNEILRFNDLFAGYIGFSFFNFAGYFLLWISINAILSNIFSPLSWIWMLVTLFVAPLMFFMNQPLFKAIKLSFSSLKTHLGIILLCFLIAVIFKFAGLIFFLIGFVFTYPFTTAMIYSLYQTIYKENYS